MNGAVTVGPADRATTAEPAVTAVFAPTAEPARAAGPADPAWPSADDAVTHGLLRCVLREVAGPRGLVTVVDDHVQLGLPRSGVTLRVRLRRRSPFGLHQLRGPALVRTGDVWSPLPWDRLARVVRDELSLGGRRADDEFLAQVADHHRGVRAALAAPPATSDGSWPEDYLASERSVRLGHRHHPTPKARDGHRDLWAAFAPEAAACFPLEILAVREDFVAEAAVDDTARAALDRLHDAPAGHRVLPVHPWQFRHLAGRRPLRAAIDRGDILPLGPSGRRFSATASVRTVYDGTTFLKLSLHVRITNCVRKNARYELAGAVALTHLIEPLIADLAVRFPTAQVLREPAYRTVAVPGPAGEPDRELFEGLGVIVREGLAGARLPGTRPLLAAAIAEEYATGPAHLSRLLDRPSRHRLLDWWRGYLAQLVPPVLAAYFDHGIVLEPHLQNVVVGIGADGIPAQVLFRDLEGTKLVADRHTASLAGLPREVADAVAYDASRGWDRVVYCLIVNHLAELIATTADLAPDLEPALWAQVRDVLADQAGRLGNPPRLRDLLAGSALPAKANLHTRWRQRPDREATYVRLPSPLVGASLIPVFRGEPAR